MNQSDTFFITYIHPSVEVSQAEKSFHSAVDGGLFSGPQGHHAPRFKPME